ncbi:MAG: hypothetical protein HYY23_05975 [Verrucomicrobia bacterium]|nr:hypothetical protein [Verrucomicrobiota bacterium]
MEKPGHPQSPVDPVVGIDRATAEEFALWAGGRWKGFGNRESTLPSLGVGPGVAAWL